MAGEMTPARWANVFWLDTTQTGTVTPSELNGLAAGLLSLYGAMIAHMLNTVSLTNCELSLFGSGEDLTRGSATGGFSGGLSGQGVTAQAAIAISWQVAIGYRGGHPRTYLPGVPFAQLLSNQAIAPSYASTLATGAETFRTGVNATTTSHISALELGTVSFVRNKNWRVPPVFIPFTGAHVDTRVDSQRRRLGPDV